MSTRVLVGLFVNVSYVVSNAVNLLLIYDVLVAILVLDAVEYFVVVAAEVSLLVSIDVEPIPVPEAVAYVVSNLVA